MTATAIETAPRPQDRVIKRSVKFGMRRTEFSTGVEILIKVADKRRVRGRTVVAVVADEVAHWFSEEHHSNPDVEVLNAIRPGMLGVPGALLIGISSPYRRAGELFETDQRVWAKNGSPILFIRAATWVMRPDTPDHHARYPTFTAELEAERERLYRLPAPIGSERFITVAIPTCNRPQDLNRCLSSLSRVESTDWRLLVVDQSDDDRSCRVVEDWKQSIPHLEYLRLADRNASAARNLAIQDVGGGVIAFLDDDCTVTPEWITQVREAFAREPDASLIFGAVVAADHPRAAFFVPA